MHKYSLSAERQDDGGDDNLFYFKSVKNQEGFVASIKGGSLFGKLINLFSLEYLYHVLENVTYLHR